MNIMILKGEDLRMELERDHHCKEMHSPHEKCKHSMHEKCKRSMHYHAVFTMKDGRKFDGIILKVENDHVYALMGEEVMEHEDKNNQDGYDKCNEYRQFNQFGGRRRFRRFVPRRFPIGSLIALSLLSYPPYPYYYPYYYPYIW